MDSVNDTDCIMFCYIILTLMAGQMVMRIRFFRIHYLRGDNRGVATPYPLASKFRPTFIVSHGLLSLT